MLAITKAEFKKLADYIKANYGINLTDEKEALVAGRLQTLVQEQGFRSFSDYFEYVLYDKTGQAAAALANRITTNHTFFMRETDHFFFFRDQVLPYLKTTVRDRDLRIWSAGCSTGEEPFTLAMIIDEFFGADKVLWDTKILATDIADHVLKEARRGIYSNEETAKLPPHWRLSYFEKLDSQTSLLNKRIRDEVIFRKLNLMDKTFPFRKKFQVIFCRNVMIYFDAPTKRTLIQKFYDGMERGGYLFIGHSESINRNETLFKYVIPAVYRKD